MGDIWGGGLIDERPTHQVKVSSFYIGKYEVTQRQYEAVMGTNPSNHKGKNLPVVDVSWYDAVRFCNQLSEHGGLEPSYSFNGTNVTCDFSKNGYRLPTEAEWEYAVRGGNQSQRYKYSGSDHPDNVAWYDDNSGEHTHEVGTKQPNELGLYDMSGNVAEWCWDWYAKDYYSHSASNNPMGPDKGSYRVIRGGSWSNGAKYLRASNRVYADPSYSFIGLGFRLLRAR